MLRINIYILLSVMLFLFSCRNKTESADLGTSLDMQWVTLEGFDNGKLRYIFNASGDLSVVNSYEGSNELVGNSTITTTDSEIVAKAGVVYNRNEFLLSNTFVATKDEWGRVTAVTMTSDSEDLPPRVEKLYYNNDGYIDRIVSANDTLRFSWSDGNMVKAEWGSRADGGVVHSVDIEYTSEVNHNFNLDLNWIIYPISGNSASSLFQAMQVAGGRNRDMISNYSYRNDYSIHSTGRIFTYTHNNEGVLSKVEINSFVGEHKPYFVESIEFVEQAVE